VKRAAILVGVMGLFVAACSNDGYAIHFNLSLAPEIGSADAARIATLTITTSNAETFSTTINVTGKFNGGSATLRYRPRAQSGELDATFLASDAGGAAIAGGSVAATLVAGQTKTYSVTLSAASIGGSDDMGAADDLGGADLAGTCTEGATQPCYDGPSATRGVGACKDGTQTCVGGAFTTTCSGEVLPQSADKCDNIDENCDGNPNTGCACTNGAMQTCNMGLCNPTTVTCANGMYPSCPAPITMQSYRTDADGDGYCVGSAMMLCPAQAGSTVRLTSTCNAQDDCNDASASVNAKTEFCRDQDTDTYCNLSLCGIMLCSAIDATYVAKASCPAQGDCNDLNNQVFPGQTLYFYSPASGMTNPWDYDCSGATEKTPSAFVGTTTVACSNVNVCGTTCANDGTSNCVSGAFYCQDVGTAGNCNDEIAIFNCHISGTSCAVTSGSCQVPRHIGCH
jgi:hypothetical protein